MYSANSGDSRGILVSFSPQNGIKIESLTRDHKPDIPEEKERILRAGGRVHAYKGNEGENLGPERVWLGTEDSPGLAMSRSIGDGQAHSVGVISEPGKISS